jgi:hypothetical protein
MIQTLYAHTRMVHQKWVHSTCKTVALSLLCFIWIVTSFLYDGEHSLWNSVPKLKRCPFAFSGRPHSVCSFLRVWVHFHCIWFKVIRRVIYSQFIFVLVVAFFLLRCKTWEYNIHIRRSVCKKCFCPQYVRCLNCSSFEVHYPFCALLISMESPV